MPEGNGTFATFERDGALAFNNAGQMVFEATLVGTPGGSADDRGLYFHDDSLGLRKIVRAGDALLGSTVSDFRFRGNYGSFDSPHGNVVSGFNNSGKVAYRFSLADGRSGVVLWTQSAVPPTPTPTPSPSPAPAPNPAPSADAIPPEIRIRGRKSVETLRKRVVVRGNASDASGIAKLDVKARGAKVRKAKVLSGDRFKVVLRVSKTSGRVIVKIRAIDNAGNRSKKSKLRVLRR